MEVVPDDMDIPSDLAPETLQAWQAKLADATLTTADFCKYWMQWVPKVYSPTYDQSCLNWRFDEECAHKILFSILEEFICGGEPAPVLARLSALDRPATVCGRVFKIGEPTYSCRECGMDHTCVLCVDCFKQSEHRLHKYKMGTSQGGGCCDCGDTEAWRRAPYCRLHAPPPAGAAPPDGLPAALQERARLVFDAVLWYAYSLLSTGQIADVRLGAISEDCFKNDFFCTILYNDEVHTFEQVIGTLTRVLKCSQRTAIEFVTNIDREGRAVVKCSNFDHCMELKQDIEKYTSRHGNKPLKVIVHHAYVIAHQLYAMKLLTWLHNFLGHGPGFRAIFAEAVLKPQTGEPSIVKGILMRDSTLWKSARSQWQKLLISGMLLEYENKKELAKIFTKHYGSVMKDFIKDDHDHAFSISSLSVQLFTVPTLAHHLIANDDVLYILLNTFFSECSTKCNKAGKLEFEKSPSSHSFKRSHFMLFDLRYLLSSVPETWHDDLRKNFLHGLSVLMNLFTKMQGMDAVARQIGQHMEYEPEWESAFNLHIRLAFCITLAIKWCSTDKVVLVKAYRAVLKKLEEIKVQDPLEAIELADHSTSCIIYDVAASPVSIHLPLSRFLAGLHLHLDAYKLDFNDIQAAKLSPAEIMEPVLRAQVMIAQAHAGMWRRNGYALLNQLYFYQNVKCRTEMLDRDISLLQMCASLIESNEFLIHVLHKYNLINWALPNNEAAWLKQSNEDMPGLPISIIEECLQLLIVIIGERYTPGVCNISDRERIKKEIMQYLCIRPMPHSELNKIIADDYHEYVIDEIIDELATFKKPAQGTGKGVYELKDEYYDEFNVFFYHYTREELSKSEEAQRNRRKTAGALDCCPPPKLPKLNESFHLLVNLLQCDVMLHIIQTVLERCIDLSAKSFSELQLHKVLHLVGYALQEEESMHYPFFKFIQNAAKFRIFELIEQLVDSKRVETHKALIQWTLRKYNEVAKIEPDPLPIQPNTSPSTSDEKTQRAKFAAERRAKILAQMQEMQKCFIKDNATLFEENETPIRSSTSAMDISELNEAQPIALGPKQTTRLGIEKTYVCILCQEEERVVHGGPTLVLAAFVQQSTVLCQSVEHRATIPKTVFLPANLGPAPHTSTCGHVMHAECWRKYFDSVMAREHRRPYRLRHPASFDVDKQEFLCPLCERLSNTVLPLVPALSTLQPTVKNQISYNEFLACINVILASRVKVCHGNIACNNECPNEHCKVCTLQEDMEVCEADCGSQGYQVLYACDASRIPANLAEQYRSLFPSETTTIDPNLKQMVEMFTQVTYTRGLCVLPHPTDKRIMPMAWKSLAYTIHSIEVSLRDDNKPLLGHLSSRQRDCIEGFVRIVGVLGSTAVNSVVGINHALGLIEGIFNGVDFVLMDADSFSLLVSLTFSMPGLGRKERPTPIPTGGSLDWHLLRTIYTLHIVKVLLQYDLNESMDTGEEQRRIIHQLLRKEELDSDVWRHVEAACVPFLRACCLFYHYLTDVPEPAVLTEIGGDTFGNMCEYLDLPPTPAEVFDSGLVDGLVRTWAENYEQHPAMVAVKEPLGVNRLIDLPNDYSELINMVSTFTCPNSAEDSRTPSMCLVCGKVLCSQSYCCQREQEKVNVGACNYHAQECGAGVGVFLRVRECEILFLASPHRGTFACPPYLDDYGETDMGLRRGNPLKLCRERYRKLQTMWLSHSVHEEIARSIESSPHLLSTQWHHL